MCVLVDVNCLLSKCSTGGCVSSEKYHSLSFWSNGISFFKALERNRISEISSGDELVITHWSSSVKDVG